MSFPAQHEHEDGRGLFVVQDPYLRSKILPLFSFDPHNLTTRPIGHGTAFRIDPWGGCATAFHVIEDLLEIADGQAVLRDDIRLVALEFEGTGYGTVSLPADSWRPFSGLFSLCSIDSPPIGLPRIRNVTELAGVKIVRSGSVFGPATFLPIDLRRWRPAIGERVMALGFGDLDLDRQSEGDARAMSQYLYGSEATIMQVQLPDGNSSRPWPIVRVEADWPGGMSGGPVFNEAGHVVGVVSTGIGSEIGAATFFSGWNLAEATFQVLDPQNPGYIKCWVAFDANENILSFAPTKDRLDLFMGDRKVANIRATVLNPATGDYWSV